MDRILEIGTGYWATQVLLSAIELDVFTVLGRETFGRDQLIAEVGIHHRGAGEFVDALVALGLLEATDAGYRNTRESRLFLDRTGPLFVGGSFAMVGPRLWHAWAGLTAALRSGRAQYPDADKGDELFAGIYADPAVRESFLRSMSGASAATGMALARTFPWAEHRLFADIGAAAGTVAVQLARHHPHLRGIGADLAPVRPVFEAVVAEHDLADRLTFATVDFFRHELPPADVLILGHILHDWDVEQRRDLIAKAWRALEPGGRLLIYEAFIAEDRTSDLFPLLMSLNMLVDTPGGSNFTVSECTSWLAGAGFRSTSVTELPGPDTLLVAVR